MSLNIKNERVHALAREVARRTGRSQTSAVEDALARRLDELMRHDAGDARRARLLRLIADARAEGEPGDSRGMQDALYDSLGLPG